MLCYCRRLHRRLDTYKTSVLQYTRGINMFARFDAISSMALQYAKESIRYGDCGIS